MKKHLPKAIYRNRILTLDLPNARYPVIWRQEMKNISSLSFALHPEDNGDTALVLRAGDGAEQIIASFDHPDKADAALSVLRVLLTRQRNGWKNIVKVILFLVGVWLALCLAFNLYLNGVAAQAVKEVTAQPQITEPPVVAPAPPSVPAPTIESTPNVPPPPAENPSQ